MEAARALHGKVTSDGGWASLSQQVTMECGEGKQKEGEEIVLCVCCYWTEAESDREKNSVPIPPIRCSLVPVPPIPAKTLKTQQPPDSCSPDTDS